MDTKRKSFNAIKLGDRFIYDNDLFVKTGPQLAWEIRAGRRYKEWAFLNNETVELLLQ